VITAGTLSLTGIVHAQAGMNMMVVSGIAVTMFLGGWLLPFGIHPPGWADPLVVIAKMLLVITFFIWIRATFPAFATTS
jgi:NADH:ubiquinone oxidoreductase subunit H